MIKLKLVSDNIGATYTSELFFNPQVVAWYIIEERFEDYPVCVNFAINDNNFRVRFEDFKEYIDEINSYL